MYVSSSAELSAICPETFDMVSLYAFSPSAAASNALPKPNTLPAHLIISLPNFDKSVKPNTIAVCQLNSDFSVCIRAILVLPISSLTRLKASVKIGMLFDMARKN